jgi:hypothetical protein
MTTGANNVAFSHFFFDYIYALGKAVVAGEAELLFSSYMVEVHLKPLLLLTAVRAELYC